MSGTQEILQEYLVKLGYQTDAISLRKFEDGLGKTGKSILGMGTKVAATVAVVETAAAAFAYSMRQVYFSAELSNTSVRSLKAMEYAGAQVGISADAMGSSLHAAAKELRNPGVLAYANALTGMNEAGKETGDVLNDLVNSTKKYNEVTGASIMSVFGMDADTYHMWRGHGDELMAKEREHKALQDAMGVDYKKNEAIIKEYTNTLDRLEARFSSLTNVMLSRSLPLFKTTAAWIDHVMEGWTRLLDMKPGKGSLWEQTFGKPEPESPKTSTSGKINRHEVIDASAAETGQISKAEFDRRLHAKFIKPGSVEPLADLVGKGEGGYFSVNLGQAGNYKAAERDLSSMTVQEVMTAQKAKEFNAAGKYQIIGPTLEMAAKSLGLKGDEKFNKELQDRIFKEFLIEKKQPAILEYISGRSTDRNAALRALESEWASMKTQSGTGIYDKPGQNKATIGVNEQIAALDQTRLGNTNVTNTTTHITNDIKMDVRGIDARATADAVVNKLNPVIQQSNRYALNRGA